MYLMYRVTLQDIPVTIRQYSVMSILVIIIVSHNTTEISSHTSTQKTGLVSLNIPLHSASYSYTDCKHVITVISLAHSWSSCGSLKSWTAQPRNSQTRINKECCLCCGFALHSRPKHSCDCPPSRLKSPVRRSSGGVESLINTDRTDLVSL